MKKILILCTVLAYLFTNAQPLYPKGYFRNPLSIPMLLVANFGELRANHWHMGLDIRTQQRENLPVHAAAEGYIAKVKIEPDGFGRALYINHPAGFTTVYAHLNDFDPVLENWVKEQQYAQEAWEVELSVPPNLFPVEKGAFIAYSGNTGGSQGPHVHFEIRDTKTDRCLNPLLFHFPVADAVPPTLIRLGMYDRGRSIYAQTPQLVALKKVGSGYTLAKGSLLTASMNKVSFAIGAVDRFTGSGSGNGIYSAHLFVDDVLQSGFTLDNIDYTETRYLNAQIDYRYKYSGGPYLQHLSRMPGDTSTVYELTPTNGIIYLNDSLVHTVRLEVRDAAQNLSLLQFTIQKINNHQPLYTAETKLLPTHVTIFETPLFEAFTTEYTLYDTAAITYNATETGTANAVSAAHSFLGPWVPAHDSITVRINLTKRVGNDTTDKVVIKSLSGSRTVVEKGVWLGGWVRAKFRQFGSYQAFIDNQPPTINSLGSRDTVDLRRLPRIVFIPKDNFTTINYFRAELDGQWLRFTNDKGKSWVYKFDEKFPPGVHQLKVTVEDVAGNVTTKTWYCRR